MSSRLLIILNIMLLTMLCWLSQAQTIHGYEYDSSGNRISRRIIMLRNATTERDNETKEDIKDILNGFTINIYPNPTNGTLYIDHTSTDSIPTFKLYIYDLKGTLLINKTTKEKRTLLDLSKKPKGTYLLRIISEDSSSDWKIIKE